MNSVAFEAAVTVFSCNMALVIVLQAYAVIF
jgi:hypothetical protein